MSMPNKMKMSQKNIITLARKIYTTKPERMANYVFKRFK
mgnify:CR=1 FL=1